MSITSTSPDLATPPVGDEEKYNPHFNPEAGKVITIEERVKSLEEDMAHSAKLFDMAVTEFERLNAEVSQLRIAMTYGFTTGRG